MEKIVLNRDRIESNPGDISPSNNRIESNDLSSAQQLADRLRDKNPDAVWFYYKVVKKLHANTIDRLAVAALEKAKIPGAYFNRCAMNEMSKSI